MSDTELKELVASLARQQEETARQVGETSRHLRRVEGAFHNQVGLLVEAIMEPQCLELLRGRGIHVERSMRNVTSQRAGAELEVDVLLINTTELVAVEVKTRCKVGDVDRHEERLEKFRRAFPEWSGYRVHGAIAALEFVENCDRYAAKQGLFVIQSDGLDLRLLNEAGFQPRAF